MSGHTACLIGLGQTMDDMPAFAAGIFRSNTWQSLTQYVFAWQVLTFCCCKKRVAKKVERAFSGMKRSSGHPIETQECGLVSLIPCTVIT